MVEAKVGQPALISLMYNSAFWSEAPVAPFWQGCLCTVDRGRLIGDIFSQFAVIDARRISRYQISLQVEMVRPPPLANVNPTGTGIL